MTRFDNKFDVSSCLRRERERVPGVRFPVRLYTGSRFVDEDIVFEWVHKLVCVTVDYVPVYTTGVERVYVLTSLDYEVES